MRVMVLKELIFNSFYCGRVWWFFERTHFNTFYFCRVNMVVLKELIFNSFYIGDGVVVLKELIFNSFYFK